MASYQEIAEQLAAGQSPGNYTQANPTGDYIPLSQIDKMVEVLSRAQQSDTPLPRSVLQSGPLQALLGPQMRSGGEFDAGPLFERGGLSEASQMMVSQLQDLQTYTVSTIGDYSHALPREQTSPGGFMRMLEWLQSFNYAVAGMANAFVNLGQGEGVEGNNPIVEFWKGLTIQDTETFADVFENLGWDGEDTGSSWSREILGFIADVALDPLTYVTLGTSAVGARLLGKSGFVAMSKKGTREVAGVSKRLIEKIGPQGEHIGELISRTTNPDIKLALQDVADRIAKNRSETIADATKGGLGAGGTLEDVVFSTAQATTIEAGLRSEVTSVLQALIQSSTDDVGLAALQKQAVDMANKPGLWLGQVSKNNGGMAYFVLDDLVTKAGGKAADDLLTPQHVLDWMKPLNRKTGKNALIDHGGIRIHVPFRPDKEIQLLDFNGFDKGWFKIRVGTQKTKAKIAEAWGEKVVADSAPAALRVSGKAVAGTGKIVAGALSGGFNLLVTGVRNLGKLFGADFARSHVLLSALKGMRAKEQQAVDIVNDFTKRFIQPIIDADHTEGALESMIVNAFHLEQKGALQHRQQMLVKGSGVNSMADYETQHLDELVANISRNYGEETAQKVQSLVGETQTMFNRQWQVSIEEGVEIGYMDFAMPAQYKGVESVFARRTKMQAEATGAVDEVVGLSDRDPFNKVRLLDPTDKDALAAHGLELNTNLIEVVGGRILASERAMNARWLFRKLQSQFMVNENLVEDFFHLAGGPGGVIGTSILKGLRQQIPTAEFMSKDRIYELVPELKELDKLVGTGQFPEAREWLKNNRDSLPPSIVDDLDRDTVVGPDGVEFVVGEGPAEPLSVNVRKHLETMMLASRYAIDEGFNVMHKVYVNTLEEAANGFMGDFMEGWTVRKGKLSKRVGGEANREGDVELVAAMGSLIEARVRRHFGYTDDVSIGGLLAGSRSQHKTRLELMGMGTDVSRAALVEDILLAKKPNKRLAKEVEAQMSGDLDKLAKEMVDMVRASDMAIDGVNVTSKYASFNPETAVLLSRMFPVHAFESHVSRNTGMTWFEIKETEIIEDVNRINNLMGSGNSEGVKDAAEAFFNRYGTHDIVLRASADIGRVTGQAGGAAGGLDMFKRLHDIIEEMRTAALAGRFKSDFLGTPLYAFPGKLGKQQATEFTNNLVAVARIARGDKDLQTELQTMLNTARSNRAGLDYDPFQAVRATMGQSHFGEGSRFLDEFEKAAASNDPGKVIGKIRGAITSGKGGLVGPIKGAASKVAALLETTVNRELRAVLRETLRKAATSGVSAKRVKAEFRAVMRTVRESLELEAGTMLSSVEVPMRDAFRSLGERFKDLFPNMEFGLAAEQLMFETADNLAKIHNAFGRQYTDLLQIRSTWQETLGRPAHLFQGDDGADIEKLVGIRESVIKRMDEVGERIDERFAGIPNAPENPEQLAQQGRVDKLAGVLEQQAKRLNSMGSAVSPEIVEKQIAQANKIYESYRVEAQRAVDSTRSAERLASEEFFQLDEEFRFLEDVVGVSIVGNQEELAGLLGRATGLQVDFTKPGSVKRAVAALDQDSFGGVDTTNVLKVYLSAAVADEYLQAGGRGLEDWLAAVETVSTTGTQNQRWKFLNTQMQGMDPKIRARLFEDLAGVGGSRQLSQAGRRSAEEWNSLYSTRPTLPGVTPGQVEARLAELLEGSDLSEGIVSRNFLQEVEERAVQLRQSRGQTTEFLEDLQSAAMVHPTELRATLAALRKEGTWVSAFFDVLEKESKLHGTDPLGRIVNDLTNTVARLDVDKILPRLGEHNAILKGIKDNTVQPLVDAAELGTEAGRTAFREKLEAMGVAQAEAASFTVSLSQRTGFQTKAEAFRVYAKNEINLLYGAAAENLDDVAGANLIKTRGARVSLTEAMSGWDTAQIKALREGALDDETMGRMAAELHDLLNDIDPAIIASTGLRPSVPDDVYDKVSWARELLGNSNILRESDMGARAQHYLGLLGVHAESGAKGVADLPMNARKRMLRELTGHQTSGEFSATLAAQHSGLNQRARALSGKVHQQVGARKVAEMELNRLEDTVIPGIKDMQKRMRTQAETMTPGDPEFAKRWEFTQGLRSHLDLQELRYERDLLQEMLRVLPAENELILERLRRHMPTSDVDIDKMRYTRQRGDVEVDAQLDQEELAMRLGAFEHEALREDLPRMLAGPAARILDRTGVSLSNSGTSTEMLEELFTREVAGVNQATDGSLSVDFEYMRATYGRQVAVDVDEVMTYISLAENPSANVGNFPITDMQARNLERIMSELSPKGKDGTLIRSWYPYALAGTHNIGSLTVREAAIMTHQLSQQMSAKFTGVRNGIKGLPDAEKYLTVARAHSLGNGQVMSIRHSVEETRAVARETAADNYAGRNEAITPVHMPGVAGTLDNYGRRTPEDIAWVPKWAADILQREFFGTGKSLHPQIQTMLKATWDPITNTWKSFNTIYAPAFHVRNIADVIYRGFLGLGLNGLRPTHNLNVSRVMRGEGTVSMRQNGQDVTMDAAMLKNLAINKGLRIDAREKIGHVKAVQQSGLDGLNPASAEYIFNDLNDAIRGTPAEGIKKGAQKVNETIMELSGKADNTMRISLFLNAIERGASYEDAARFAQKFVYDYDGLASFEKSYMRRLFPFYTFSRFNVPFSFGLMFKRPGVLSFVGKTQHLFGDSDNDDLTSMLPTGLRKSLHSAYKLVTQDGVQKLQFFSGANVLHSEEIGFLGDLNFWRGADAGVVDTAMRETLGRLNPLLRVPVELVMGKTFYMGRNFEEDKDVQDALRVPGLTQWLDMRKVAVGDRIYTRVNAHRWVILQSSHFGRMYRAFQTAFDDDQGALQRFLPLATGMRLNTVDLSRQRDWLIHKGQMHDRAIGRAISEGDHIKAWRLIHETERPQEERLELDASLEKLQSLVGDIDPTTTQRRSY